MKRSIAMSWCAGLAVLVMAAPVSAQTTVQGAVVVQSGPSNTPLADRARRTMGAEVVIVQRVQGRYGWWRRGYRAITIYSDGERFYRRPFGRTALRKVVVYERGGRYFINDDQWKWHHDYHDRYIRDYGHDNDHDSYDDRNGHDDRNEHDDHGNAREHHDNGNHYGWNNH
jgi:hypothetical protein